MVVFGRRSFSTAPQYGQISKAAGSLFTHTHATPSVRTPHFRQTRAQLAFGLSGLHSACFRLVFACLRVCVFGHSWTGFAHGFGNSTVMCTVFSKFVLKSLRTWKPPRF